MKLPMIAIALIGATATASAFAQSAPATQQPQTYSTAQVASANVPAAAAGQWTAPYGQPVQEKTRAQVYHELIQAEKDGQLDYMNSTLYSH